MTTPLRRRPLCVEPVEDRVLLSLFAAVAPVHRPEPFLSAPPAEHRFEPRSEVAFAPVRVFDRAGWDSGPPTGHAVRPEEWQHTPQPSIRVVEEITVIRVTGEPPRETTTTAAAANSKQPAAASEQTKV